MPVTAISFQSSFPRGERRVAQVHVRVCCSISIHAPRAGSDKCYLPVSVNFLNFKPRPPRGERRAIKRCPSDSRTFQSTLPCGERQDRIRQVGTGQKFTLQPGLRSADALGVDAECDELGLGQAVVTLGKLVFEHIRVLGADAVKGVVLRRDRDAPLEILHACAQVKKGKLKTDAGIEIVEEITPAFKDCRLILVLRELVVDVLELNGFGKERVRHPAHAVRIHVLVWDGLLRRQFFGVTLNALDGSSDLFALLAG